MISFKLREEIRLEDEDEDEDEDEEREEIGDPTIELTYFQFNRLAGFMCWGFIMGFFNVYGINFYKFIQFHKILNL